MRRLRVGFFVFSTWHATLLASLLLIGCHTKVYRPLDDDPPNLPRRVEGTDDKVAIKLQKSLTRCGVAVITVGQDYLISIPSYALFPNQSPHLTWRSYGLLNQVARFLKEFRKIGVNITAYSGRYVSDRREHALTLARARTVADYLWSQGIDSRFIFTEGAGSEKPIMSFSRGGDKTPNSRIEITFRNAIV